MTNLVGGPASLILTLDDPARDDLAGVKVWASTSSGFAPGPSNLVYEGKSLTVTISDLLINTPYYVKYAYISDIAPETYSVSEAELAATTLAVPWNKVGGEGRPADNATRNVHRGPWAASTYYAAGDTVIYLGSGWSCTQAHTSSASNVPPEVSSGTSSYWTVAAVKGEDGLVALLSNEVHTFTSDSLGQVASYADSGTRISVYEGASALMYDPQNTGPGRWKLSAAGTNITVGNITDAVSYAQVSDHVLMTADTAIVLYTITGQTVAGGSFTLYKSQTFSKAKSGADGANGKGISSVANKYFAHTSGTDAPAPTASWQATIPALTDANKYLWNQETITFSDSTTSTVYYLISQKGDKGNTGISISTITEKYKEHNSPTTAPTTGWSTTIPTLTDTNRYLWSQETITFSDASTTTLTKLIGTKGKDASYLKAFSTQLDYTSSPGSIDVNGTAYSVGSRGHTLVVLNPATGMIQAPVAYDTYGAGTSSLITALNAVTKGSIVILASYDATACDADLRTALRSMGSQSTATWGPLKVSHVFIGQAGAAIGTAYEYTGSGGTSTGTVQTEAYYTSTGLMLNGAANQRISANRATTFVSTDGTLDLGQADLVLTSQVSGISSPAYVWTFTGLQTNPIASTTNTQTITAANFGTAKSAYVTCTVNGIFTDKVTIVRLERSTAEAGATVGAQIGTNLKKADGSGATASDFIASWNKITDSNNATFIDAAAIRSAAIKELTADKITTGSLNASTKIIAGTETSGIILDGGSNLLSVNDAGSVRVKLGKLTSNTYGVQGFEKVSGNDITTFKLDNNGLYIKPTTASLNAFGSSLAWNVMFDSGITQYNEGSSSATVTDYIYIDSLDAHITAGGWVYSSVYFIKSVSEFYRHTYATDSVSGAFMSKYMSFTVYQNYSTNTTTSFASNTISSETSDSTNFPSSKVDMLVDITGATTGTGIPGIYLKLVSRSSMAPESSTTYSDNSGHRCIVWKLSSNTNF